MLDVNSTSVLVHLSTWGDGGCPILYYVIEYRVASARVSGGEESMGGGGGDNEAVS